ncbi:hypothetical protein BH10PSE18_BH10PSE18_07920 [soil metagenome]
MNMIMTGHRQRSAGCVGQTLVKRFTKTLSADAGNLRGVNTDQAPFSDFSVTQKRLFSASQFLTNRNRLLPMTEAMQKNVAQRFACESWTLWLQLAGAGGRNHGHRLNFIELIEVPRNGIAKSNRPLEAHLELLAIPNVAIQQLLRHRCDFVETILQFGNNALPATYQLGDFVVGLSRNRTYCLLPRAQLTTKLRKLRSRGDLKAALQPTKHLSLKASPLCFSSRLQLFLHVQRYRHHQHCWVTENQLPVLVRTNADGRWAVASKEPVEIDTHGPAHFRYDLRTGRALPALVAADLRGSHAGGFRQCLLRHSLEGACRHEPLTEVVLFSHEQSTKVINGIDKTILMIK